MLDILGEEKFIKKIKNDLKKMFKSDIILTDYKTKYVMYNYILNKKKSALCAAMVMPTALLRQVFTYERAAAARPAGDGVGAAEEGTHVRTHGEAQPPRQPAGHYGEWPNWANVLEQPPARLRGGLRRGPQASAWGLAARKDAVWEEGLADDTPWARPGHHQAASCGLRRCWELRIMAKTDRP